MTSTTRSQPLTEALSRLITQASFFASYLYDQMSVEDSTNFPTAATDGKRIYVNPIYLGKQKDDGRVFLLAHETLHAILQHLPRAKLYKDRGFGPDLKPWNQAKANQAMDYIINAMLIESGYKEMPEGGLLRDDIDSTMVFDEVYTMLPDPDPDDDSGFDEHLEPADDLPSDAEVKRALASAKNVAKAQGHMPAALERLVNEIIEPAQDWKAILYETVTAVAGRDSSTWHRPNRRKLVMAPHPYMPGTTGFQIGGLAIVADTSGSVSDTEMAAFMGVMHHIVSDCKPEWCKVLWTDAKVQRVDDVEDPEELLTLKPAGGGGTDMGAAFKYMADNDIVPEQCIVLTDMHTPFGPEPAYKVIWGGTSDIQPPWGQFVHVDVPS